MTKTKKGSIYRIYNTSGDCYIGSTRDKLRNRLYQHRTASLKRNGLLYECMRSKGRQNFKIELLEKFRKIDTPELKRKEGERILNDHPNLNKNIAGRDVLASKRDWANRKQICPICFKTYSNGGKFTHIRSRFHMFCVNGEERRKRTDMKYARLMESLRNIENAL